MVSTTNLSWIDCPLHDQATMLPQPNLSCRFRFHQTRYHLVFTKIAKYSTGTSPHFRKPETHSRHDEDSTVVWCTSFEIISTKLDTTTPLLLVRSLSNQELVATTCLERWLPINTSTNCARLDTSLQDVFLINLMCRLSSLLSLWGTQQCYVVYSALH